MPIAFSIDILLAENALNLLFKLRRNLCEIIDLEKLTRYQYQCFRYMVHE